ncbi:ABC transporter permease [Candidatus Halobonum tyrrellensis]|uniref:Binding-protein-dependent transporters inner membrane component n=1 Tax=Candidatus Halobonum tyrrellensis G22 TaxID=1324957 RepID=V4GRX7_9EURY|nr:ABC transporter permease [Candidatus Halobonum tyrrellensis]ESP87791.1 binding-protein-dependent transporters inner membrane component [Candidatus Halobonum tyrrellensis G22]
MADSTGPLDRLFGAVDRVRGALTVSPRTVRNLKSEYRTSALSKVGVALILVVVFMAVFAPFIAPQNPTTQNLDNGRLPPLGFTQTEQQTQTQMVNGSIQTVNTTETVNATLAHPLGTNSLGQDMLARVIYGARTSLLVGLLGTSLAALLGVSVGLTAGYYRGRVDDTLMRFADVSLAFPSLVLAIALIGVWGRASVSVPDPFVVAGVVDPVRSALGLPTPMPDTFVLPGTVIVVVGLVNWVWFARVARGEALSIREEEFVKAARALGADDARVVLRHVLPNATTPILVLATIQVASIILLESSLSFLGFSGTTLSWGFDIAQGRAYLASAWWIATVPGLAIVLTVVGINLVGDWLRDALDPGIEGEGGM